MCPYLKGILHTLNSLRTGRDKDGWKLERREMILCLASKEGEVDLIKENEAPEDVFPVVRLQYDIQALEFLLKEDEPTRI